MCGDVSVDENDVTAVSNVFGIAIVAILAAMLLANHAVPEPAWLPGAEAFRAEAQRQLASMEKAAQ